MAKRYTFHDKGIVAEPKHLLQFYDWRLHFELKKHDQVYRQPICKQCGSKVQRMKTGSRQRISFICPFCQKNY